MNKGTLYIQAEYRTCGGWGSSDPSVADAPAESYRNHTNMPKLPKTEPPKTYQCPACEDTGRNSKGGECIPCIVFGRLERERKEAAKQPRQGFIDQGLVPRETSVPQVQALVPPKIRRVI